MLDRVALGMKKASADEGFWRGIAQAQVAEARITGAFKAASEVTADEEVRQASPLNTTAH